MAEPFDGYTGRGVKIAIIDSGVNPAHPHVAGVAGGIRISPSGESSPDYLDFSGHGTAVAGAIREKAPDALLYAVKVFDRELTTNIETIIRAIEWAVAENMSVINLSLGTNNSGHKEKLQRVVESAVRNDIAIVSARGMPESGQPLLPGCFPEVIGVGLDWECPRDAFKVIESDGERLFLASGYPRDIPGVPRELNFSGISFAVASLAGFVARAVEMNPGIGIQSLKRSLDLEQQSARPA
jgi:subtilisin family serine protease